MKQGWEILPFENCIKKVKYTAKIASSDYLTTGAYPIISQEEEMISGYWDKKEDVFAVSSPVVIFGDHTRVLKYVDFDFVLGADGVKILQPIDCLDAKFLMYFLKSYKIPSLGYSRHYKLLKEISVPVPERAEQEWIVGELDCLSGIIAAKRAQLRELDTLAQSIFYTMFGDPITNDKGWQTKKLPEFCTVISTGITYKPENVTDDGIIVLRSSNIQNNQFVLDDIVRINMSLKESQYVQQNDILMCSRNGSARLVGKVALIPNTTERMSWGAFMTIIRSEFYHFLFQYFQLPAFRQQLIKTKTSTVNQITIGMLKDIFVPVPPIDLQQQFAEKIENIERQKELITKSIKETEDLFNSRMDYYFN